MKARVCAEVVVSLMCAVVASAAAVPVTPPIPVGSGPNLAHSVINFGDWGIYTFDVSFEGTKTGISLFDVIEADSELTTQRDVYSFGTFISGIWFDGHKNLGYQGGNNWWHYWIKESGQSDWTTAPFGPSDHAVHDGDSEGWVYGRATPPVPEPATLGLLTLGVALLSRKKRILQK